MERAFFSKMSRSWGYRQQPRVDYIQKGTMRAGSAALCASLLGNTYNVTSVTFGRLEGRRQDDFSALHVCFLGIHTTVTPSEVHAQKWESKATVRGPFCCSLWLFLGVGYIATWNT